MGWTEYRNGKWTQKQISSEAIYDSEKITNTSFPLQGYKFYPRIVTTPESKLVIDLYRGNQSFDKLHSFHFSGSHISVGPALVTAFSNLIPQSDFQYLEDKDPIQIHSMQATDKDVPKIWNVEPYFQDAEVSVRANLNVNVEMPFYHPTIEEGLKSALRTICSATPLALPADQDHGVPSGA